MWWRRMISLMKKCIIGLPTNEGENEIYKLAKAREMRQRDLGFVRFIKDENARVLVKDDDIKCRWYHFFRQLFNESRISGEEIEWESVRQSHCDSSIQPINGEEIELSLCNMGKGKATGLDENPIEVWWCSGKEGERWLTQLFNLIFRNGKVPHEWKLSMVIPIYKNKGDAQNCSNFCGIKLLSHTMKLWE
ncbi:uncharacterized protein LOC141674420 [Apium graveolens]|uniref:uncharacterized protein LOC141674420 n=1 Tax=Apium graveolens TaxID=4045 RepID=UPI003D7BBE9D